MTDTKLRSEGRYCYLLPVAAEHAAWFGRWRSDINTLHLWTSARRVLAPSELASDFERMLSGNMTLVVLSKRLQEPVGFVQAYSFAGDWGWTYLLVYFDPQHRRPTVTLESVFLFVDYLFQAFPLRKVYADVFEYNDITLRQLERCGFKEEGRFEQHIWYDNRYWALLRLALFREEWYRQRERLNHLIEMQHGVDVYDDLRAVT